MNRSRWHKHLPIAVLVVGGGIAIAQTQTGEAVFPYVGYLEENGIAVTGERTVRVDLFATANAVESPCRSQTFSPVDLHAGRFQVEVTVPRAGGVYEACLAGGELYAGIAVGAADAAAGDLVALTSGLGGDRVRIGTVPFAAASPKAVPLLVADSVQVDGDVLAGGTVSANVLSANSAAINGALSATSARVTGAVVGGSFSGNGTVPIGGIMMWSGATVPTGWALCDGGSTNGVVTPDLRGRFVLSSGRGGGGLTERTIAQTGGSQSKALSIAEMPAHTHTLTVNTTGYTAGFNNTAEATGVPGGRNNGISTWTTDSTGSGTAFDKMPPFYVLAFIMRVQ